MTIWLGDDDNILIFWCCFFFLFSMSSTFSGVLNFFYHFRLLFIFFSLSLLSHWYDQQNHFQVFWIVTKGERKSKKKKRDFSSKRVRHPLKLRNDFWFILCEMFFFLSFFATFLFEFRSRKKHNSMKCSQNLLWMNSSWQIQIIWACCSFFFFFCGWCD